MHMVVASEATFSWRATFEPFRHEIPASAASWLDFGAVTDDRPVKDLVGRWESDDRLRQWAKAGRSRDVPEGPFVESAILKSGYYDLATAALTGAAISIDRRHALAVRRRLSQGDARRVGGHYALQMLLPLDFGWDDLPDLRSHRAIREFRVIVAEIEAIAFDQARSLAELDDAIRSEYTARVEAAAQRGLPFSGRVAMQAIGFVAGEAANLAVPLVGGAVAAAGALVAGEAVNVALRPRWLSVDRTMRGQRNGL